MASALLLSAALAAPAGQASEAAGTRVDGAVSALVPGQQPVDELLGTRLDYSTTPIPLDVQLPPLDDAEVARPVARGPVRIGIHREVPPRYRGDLAPELEWTEVADGAVVTAISLSSPDAVSVRAGLVAELPEGGEIRFFDPTQPTGRGFPAVTADAFFNGEDGEPEVLWSPTIEGEAIGVEIMLPSWEAARAFSLTLEKVAHRYRAISSPNPLPQELECGSQHIDVQCGAAAFPESMENAVGRIAFETQGESSLCSGTLLNDRDPNGHQPYFLTANHCVNTASVARSIETTWYYQYRHCGSFELDERIYTTTGGAYLLATSIAQDSTLLLLRGALPAGLVLSGWSTHLVTHPTDVYNISHPAGYPKTYAAGRTIGTEDVDVELKDALWVEWFAGTTEGGSSGSGLFNGVHLVGVLSAGPEHCGSIDWFGSFRDFYPEIARWIDTAGVGAHLGDFNGDGKADVLLRHVESSQWRYYPMDGRRVLSGAGESTLTRNPSVSVAGIGDFDGDGRDDVLMRRSNGTWYYYPMNGRRTLPGRGEANLTRNRSVSVAGVGDFDGDGRDDVLMRRSNGTWYYYPMNGRRTLPGRGEANLTRNLSVSVAGIGDFDGDGRDDVLMRRSNGTWYYYPMNGRRTLAGRGEVNLTRNLSVTVAGVGDFDGDGRDDVLMRRSNGTWYYYPMNGRRVLPGRGEANLTRNHSVSVAGIGDLDGDGRDDVLVRRSNGTWYYYPMNGRRTLPGRGEANLPSDAAWRVAGSTTGVEPPPTVHVSSVARSSVIPVHP